MAACEDFSKYVKFDVKKYYGHKDEVNCAVFSKDLAMFITGSDDNIVRIFDTFKGDLVAELEGHRGAITSIAISLDSRLIVSSSYDKTLRVWVTRKAEAKVVFRGHSKSVETVAFSSDSNVVASGSWDRHVIVWHIQKRVPLLCCIGHADVVKAILFSRDDKFLVSGCWDTTIIVWKVKDAIKDLWENEIVEISEADKDSQENDTELISDEEEGEEEEEVTEETINENYFLHREVPSLEAVERPNVPSSKRIKEANEGLWRVLKGHSGNISSFAFSVMNILASSSWDCSVILWNVANGRKLHVLKGHMGWVRAVAFSTCGTWIASAADDDTLRVYDVISGRCSKCIENDLETSFSVCFKDGGAVIAAGAAALTLTVV